MSTPINHENRDRSSEWFVPKYGPERLKSLIGMLFLPYTGMVLSYAVIGAMLAPRIYWDRTAAIAVIYFLGLGIAAHALDALGSKGIKPWGEAFTKRQLWIVATMSLVAAYSIAVYYIIKHVPLLTVVAVLEGFFVFSYNLEWFGGRCHTDMWFAFSWGFLPVVSGYVMQTNRISFVSLVVALAMALFSTIEIKTSRPYKEIKRKGKAVEKDETALMMRFEAILKSISLGVMLLGLGLLIWRMAPEYCRSSW